MVSGSLSGHYIPPGVYSGSTYPGVYSGFLGYIVALLILGYLVALLTLGCGSTYLGRATIYPRVSRANYFPFSPANW